MRPFAKGIGGECIFGRPPDQGNHPFAVYGQNWTAQGNVPRALESGRPFFQLDNGYWRPGRGLTRGYYRVCYRGLSPILLKNPPASRVGGDRFRPWRKRGRHVLIAMPGAGFGMAIGLDMPKWIASIEDEVRKHTDRQIIIRRKPAWGVTSEPIESQLFECWAVVTHSSNAAVDAVLAGIPVFVAPTSPAAPVGKLDLDIENPIMPDREHWWNSLLAQQYTLPEMKSGFMREMLQAVTLQVDNKVLEEIA